jgi:hypothetical protein
VPSATVQSWSTAEPADFLATAATELNGTSGTAGYGPPYNNATGATQSLLFAPAKILGVTQPINTAHDFVLGPLAKLTATNPRLAAALATYNAAPASQQMAWVNAYLKAVTHVKFVAGVPVVPAAADGPVPVMLATEYTMGRSGALDTDLLAHRQLPRPALALALHALVLRPGLLRLRQRGPDRRLPHRPGHHLAAGHPLHPRPARHPPLDPRPPPHLAQLGTDAGRRGERPRPGCCNLGSTTTCG